MAIRSFPFDAESGDRVLDTQQWARLTAALAGNGVVPTLADELQVTATSPETLAVDVSLGDALIQGRHFQVHSEPQTVTIATAHATNPRIDRIVVRRDMSARTVTVAAKTGTAGVSPTPPTLTQDASGVWEESLSQVFVRANATSIRETDQADGQGYVSTDERQFARSPLASIRHREVREVNSSASVTFQLPSGITVLRFGWAGFSPGLDAAANAWLRVNGDTDTNYSYNRSVFGPDGFDAARSDDASISSAGMSIGRVGADVANTESVFSGELIVSQSRMRMSGTGHFTLVTDTARRSVVAGGGYRVGTQTLSSVTFRVSGGGNSFSNARMYVEGY